MGRPLAVLVAVLASLTLVSPAAAEAPATLRIVFPEGFSARQMADRVSEVRKIAIRKRGVTPRLTGVAYARATARTLPPAGFRRYLERRSVEGFLFPSLYEFTRETRAETLVADQLAAFQSRWSTVDLSRARQGNLTPYDVLIIASMVERETAASEERRLVSAVIYNRLRKGMPLAIDATLRYGLGIPGNRPLTRRQLQADRPTTPGSTRAFRPRRSGTRACRRCAPPRDPPAGTTSTTCGGREAFATSSPRARPSSAPRPASGATPRPVRT